MQTSASLALVLALAGCTSMEVRYTADVHTEDEAVKGGPTKVIYTTSVDLGEWWWLCALTGWAGGGACYAYNAMPMKYQVGEVRDAATEAVKAALHVKSVRLANEEVVVPTWCNTLPELKLTNHADPDFAKKRTLGCGHQYVGAGN